MVTSLWFSRMMSEAFWNDGSVARKSDNFFHSIDYFRSDFPYTVATHGKQTRPPPKIVQREFLRDQQARGQLREAEVDMIENFELRESQWNAARAGWYIPLQEKWLNSPWGASGCRTHFGNFLDEYRRDPVRYNRTLCVRIARVLSHAISWHKGRDEYVNALKNSGALWPWHAVGLLMLATLHMRPQTVTHYSPTKRVCHTGTPSQQNPSKESRAWLYYYNAEDLDRRQLVPLSQFWDPLDRDGQDFIYGSFDHFDYLDLVLKLLKYVIENEIPVYKPWFDEITRVEGDIRQERTVERQQGVLRMNQLMLQLDSWNFKIPVYDPTLHYYSLTLKAWEVVPQ
ncbi:hypothetical protein F4678DRAFT_478718 [Xylaria arbuscula]|nr:hypothetical protein F4678DRAFT_478718 [Xylaria arbuscula]